MKRFAAVTLAVATVLSVALFASCQRGEKQYSKSFIGVFDTQTVIVGCDSSEKEFNKRADEIYGHLEKYHRLYDIYHEYDGVNNLKTVNDKAGVSPVKVDGDIISLLKFSKEMYALTDGMTNVAMGSVLSLWHDARTKGADDPENAAIPPMEKLSEAALHTDMEKVIVDEEKSTVYLSDPEMSLDVGAVAKGYAVEMTARYFEEAGLSGYALSVGGNVRCLGEKPSGDKWEIGVQNPDLSSDEAYIATALFTNEALVTSGSYQRFYTVEGKQYHHIIDPETLMPKDTYASVSVISDDSGIADALSTALFNLTEDEGRKIAEKAGAHVAWVYPDGRVVMTDGFREMTEQK